MKHLLQHTLPFILLTIFLSVPQSVFAAEGQPDDEIWYTTVSGAILQPYITSGFGANITDNSYQNGKGVIKFDADIPVIGDSSFFRCADLLTVSLPASLSIIGNKAFEGCSSLKEIDLPSGLSVIGMDVLKDCPELERFIGGLASEDGHCCIIQGVLRAFAPKGISTSYTLPSGIVAIASKAISDCKSLTEITIPDAVTTIGGGFLAGCGSLATINSRYATSDRKALIQDGVLKGIAPAGLSSFQVPDEVSAIDVYCFADCQNLTGIEFGNSLQTIGEGAFLNCTGLTQAHLPDQVTVWPKNLFKGCTGLTQATIHSHVASLGSGIFDGCTSLRNIAYNAENALISSTSPTEMVSIFPTAARRVTIGESVQSIPSYLFCNDTGLEAVTLPESLTSLGERIFYGCTGLDSIFCSANPPIPCKSNTFLEMGPNAHIYVPRDLVSTYESATGWRSVSSVILPDDTPREKSCLYYTSTDGQIVTPYNTSAFNCKIFSHTYENGQGVITFADTLKSIGYEAFGWCQTLKSITLPTTVTEVGPHAFYRCTGLKDIALSDRLTTIGYDAFYDCNQLRNITLPETLTSMGYRAFFNCYQLRNITLPETLASIGYETFCHCTSLDSVVCKALTPPTLEWSVFDNNAENRMIYVPQAAIEAYEQANYWSSYKDHISILSNGTAVTQEIHYTSADGEAITPVHYIGARILSNTYSNGQGTWEVDREMTYLAADAFRDESRLTGIVLPATIQSVKDHAFENCTSLTRITLPDSLKTIGQDAFYNCDSLTGVTFPDSLKTIGQNAFYGCYSLTEVTLPEKLSSIGSGAFQNCPSLKTVYCLGPTPPNIQWDTFNNLPQDARFFIPQAYLSGYETTYPWSEYKSRMYVWSDATYSLHYTSSDSAVVVPYVSRPFNAQILSNTYENGQGTFVLDRPVTTLYENAFRDCDNLVGMEIPETVSSLPNNVFYSCSALKNVSLPDSLKTIGSHAFYQCSSLTEVTFPDHLKTIGEYAFQNCHSLTKIIFPDNLQSISSYAFQHCDSLKVVSLPDKLQTIEHHAFYYCWKLDTITLPKNLTYLGEMAFGICSHLHTVFCRATVPPTLGGDPFYALPGDYRIYIPEDIFSSYEEKWVNYREHLYVLSDKTYEIRYTTSDALAVNININGFNARLLSNTYQNGNGVLTFDRPVRRIGNDAFRDCRNLTGITLPESVEEIGSNSFYNCSQLKSLVLPDNLSRIGSYAFSSCGIEELTLPGNIRTIANCTFEYSGLRHITFNDSINSIESHAFYDCSHLQSVVLPNSLTVLSEGVFYNCDSLGEVTLPQGLISIESEAFANCKSLRLSELPDSLKLIGQAAFLNSGLTGITLPKSLLSLAQGCFQRCSQLRNVRLKSTTPPVLLHTDAFSNNHASRMFLVPAGSSQTYKTTDRWREYASRIFEEEFVAPSTFLYTTADSSLITPNTYQLFKDSLLTTHVGIYENSYRNGQGILSMLDTVSVIGSNAFSWLPQLTSITLPQTVQKISSQAFSGLSQLAFITLPNTVRKISRDAFYDCRSLKEIHLQTTTPPEIEDNAFATYGDDLIVFVPSEALAAYESHSQWQNYLTYLLPEGDVPQDTITYTTSDRKKLELNEIDNIKARLLEHGFDTITGKGTLIFDRPVKSIGINVFFNNQTLTGITLPEELISIGVNAFSNCTNLKSITLPKKVRVIDASAFSYCWALDTVVCLMEKPAVLSSDNVFDGHADTRMILVPDGSLSSYEKAENWSRYASSIFSNAILNGTPYTLHYTTTDKSPVSISNSDMRFGGAKFFKSTYTATEGGMLQFDRPIEVIGENAFTNLSNLQTLEIPQTVTTISTSGFEGCTGLTKVTLPEGLKTVRAAAFSGCTRLTDIAIPESVNGIGINAFYKCSSLKTITLKCLTVPTLGENAFLETSALLKIMVPLSSVTQYEARWTDYAERIFALSDTHTLIPYTSVNGSVSPTLPSSLDGKILSNEAQNTTLKGTDSSKPYIITTDRPITLIGAKAFSGQTRLVTMDVPEGITQIGIEAFTECTALSTIELPSTLSLIGMDAFNGCPHLSRIYCRAQVPPVLGDGAFDGNASNMRICVPDSLVNTYRQADGWSEYKIHIVGDSSATAKDFGDIDTVSKPVIRLENHIVTITCATEGATIYYTLDGSQPTAADILYKDSITLQQNCTVKAFAVKDEWHDSPVASWECSDFKAEPPVIEYADGKATITTTQTGAIIHYTTDGNTPTINSSIYMQELVLTKNLTIQAIVSMDGVSNSDVAVYKVQDFSVAEPVITCSETGEVTITTSTPGARLYYTTDGTTPQKGSILYSAPFTTSSNVLVKAVGIKSDFNNSPVAVYQVAAYTAISPSITIVEHEGTALVSLACETKNAVIWYTLDGKEPSASSNRYNGSFSLNENTVIKAMSSASGMTDSPVACDTVDFFRAAPPVIDTTGLQLSLSCTTAGSTIHYTLDGTTPTNGSPVYVSPTAITRNCLIQAIATRSNYNDSEISSLSITSFVTRVPDITYFEGMVTMECSTEGAVIHYTTDGSEPTMASPVYTGPFQASTGIIVKAFASTDGYSDSKAVSITIYETNCDTPVTRFDGEYFWFEEPDGETTVYYTLDGSYPSTSSLRYEGKHLLLEDFHTVRAIAIAPGKNNSRPSSLTPTGLFHRAGMTATLKEAGSLEEAFGWCTTALSDTVVTIDGPLNDADMAFIRTSGLFEHLDLSHVTLPDYQLPDSAFHASTLISVALPDTIVSMGRNPFAGCDALAALLWNASTPFPADALTGINNPNLLVYVNLQELAPEGWGNVVVAGYAENIRLVSAEGAGNFHAPRAFTAGTISFTRTFLQKSGFNETAGWESLALPFEVQTIEHETKGVVTPFGSQESGLHFWLYSLQASGFTPEMMMQAYQPYILCLPNNEIYASSTLLGGTLTFSAKNASIKASTEENMTLLRKGNLIFRPNFQKRAADESTLVLNTYQVYEGSLPGSVFVSSLRNVQPFESYLLSSGLQGAPRTFHLSGGITPLEISRTEDLFTLHNLRSGVHIHANSDVSLSVRSLTGQLIMRLNLTAGTDEDILLEPGIYLINDRKTVVTE